MFTLPPEFSQLISIFSSTFSSSVFVRAGVLLLGSILTQGKRTVCGILRTLGLSEITNWDMYHRVLSRASWSPLACSLSLLRLLLERFDYHSPLVFAMDETLERRWGPKIKAKGIYHDAVRSSKSYEVRCSGLRWISVMLLTKLPWAARLWALPFLTVLAPSSRYHLQQGKRHKTLCDWARQICLLLHRWLPDHQLIMLGDGTYAAMDLLASTKGYLSWIVRFRLDGRLHDFPPPYRKGQRGRPLIKGKRQPSLAQRLDDPNTEWKNVRFSRWYHHKDKPMQISSGTAIWYRAGKPIVPIQWVLIRDPKEKSDPIALASTNLQIDPIQIVTYYLLRWAIEVTFEEVRAHLGIETQRQWSDLSIARTTPVLMALFSIITLWAEHLKKTDKLLLFQTAWYHKEAYTFSDAIASVRFRIWNYQLSLHSQNRINRQENLRNFSQHLAFMAARAI